MSATAIATLKTGYHQLATTFFENEPLSYEILCCSSISGNFVPENILVDCPQDETSRWTSGSNKYPQYLILRLKRPAIVTKIKFGKYKKKHDCNIEDFAVYGGLDEYRMVLLLESTLKNDNVPQVFNLRYRSNNRSEVMPIMYLKIQPIGPRASLYNYSIWYVELLGQDDPMCTSISMGNRNKNRENEIVRLCLKHFRQQGYNAAFEALREQTNVQLEHKNITDLHEAMVTSGDFPKAEELIAKFINEGLMDEYLSGQPTEHIWTLKQTKKEQMPGLRGGHQMVVDSQARLIYLFGGWNGLQNLGDLWSYNIESDKWSLLYEYKQGITAGPKPRSCHKMIFDPLKKCIYMIGRHVNLNDITVENVKSDFYCYNTNEQEWHMICEDTGAVGGPKLVYDHQVCIDAKKRVIYVFGGRIIDSRRSNTNRRETEFSGFFMYQIETDTWQSISIDVHNAYDANALILSTDCCMVFNNETRQIYFFGGSGSKEQNYDFLTYDADYGDFSLIQKRRPLKNKPESVLRPMSGFTYRATIDCARKEIYVFSSFKKSKDRRDCEREQCNSLWVYSLSQNKWSRIFYSQHTQQDPNAVCTANVLEDNQGATSLEPCPRYAHQIVYDDVGKLHYLFGGNPGIALMPNLRLGDFWTLNLKKTTREKILQHCRFILRSLCYEELIRANPTDALTYLRTSIHAVIDHKDNVQVANFHKLPRLLFELKDELPNENQSKELVKRREFIFNKLLQMLPPNMVQPQSNLSDFIVI